MICSHCKKAGEHNAQANKTETAGESFGVALLRHQARTFHACCTDVNCPCAHFVGHALNREKTS